MDYIVYLSLITNFRYLYLFTYSTYATQKKTEKSRVKALNLFQMIVAIGFVTSFTCLLLESFDAKLII